MGPSHADQPKPVKADYDFAIVGGGIIGLSIAWKLSSFGKVVLLDRNRVGREASWAAAGILPPWSMTTAVHPIERLAATSFQLHETWANQLQQETGIDTGFRRCGALFIARTAGEVAALSGQILEWRENEIEVEKLTAQQAADRVPALRPVAENIRTAALVVREAQIRNPDHLRALKHACQKNGVTILEEQGDCELITQPGPDSIVSAIQTEQHAGLTADKFCLAAGAWSEQVASKIGIKISTLPVRGQMLLYKLPSQPFTPIIYEGTRYIVPRDDGHVVVGATLEEAGFDKSTTPQGLGELKEFASSLVPELTEAKLVDAWAGLRPASFDGQPYIGPVSSLKNLWLATGHFRSGLLLSTGTAELVCQMLRGQATSFDVTPFRVERG